MKVGTAQIRGVIDRADPDTRFYLFHGPDEAAAAELAARVRQRLGNDTELIDVDPRMLRDHPGRLADEAASLSLFGSKRVIRVTSADDHALEAVELLLAADRAGSPVVAIGPALKTTAKLVKLAIGSRAAVAHACYLMEGADAVRLVSGMAREHGLRLTNDVPQRLASACAGDRAVLARELEKLALYLDAAPDRPKDADGAAIDSIGADLDEGGIFRAVEAVVEGQVDELGGRLAEVDAGGGGAVPLLRQVTTRLLALAAMRADMDAGMTIKQVLDKHRVFFKQEGSTERLLRRWNAASLARGIERVRTAERELMRSGTAGGVLAEAECVAITRAAARARG